jgi:predicted RNA-binding protein YlxR (DUF448 family)
MPGRYKRVPIRTCVVCRQAYPKRQLTRIVRTPDQGVQVDPSGKLAGRGGYLCGDPHCWQVAVDTKALDKALKTTLSSEERLAIAHYAERSVP